MCKENNGFILLYICIFWLEVFTDDPWAFKFRAYEIMREIIVKKLLGSISSTCVYNKHFLSNIRNRVDWKIVDCFPSLYKNKLKIESFAVQNVCINHDVD